VARRPRKSAKEPLEWRSRPDWLLSGGDTTSQPAAKWQLIVFPEIPASAVLHVSLYAYYPDVPLLLAVRLLAGRGLYPFVEAVERHQTASALKRLAERRLGVDLLRAGIDG
jgi:hypothetical protein